MGVLTQQQNQGPDQLLAAPARSFQLSRFQRLIQLQMCESVTLSGLETIGAAPAARARREAAERVRAGGPRER
jgi:hypothetical protein